MLVDANLLLFAVDASSPFHPAALGWLTAQLNGARRVGIPWQSLGAFLRIATNPRASDHPLASDKAWQHVEDWLDCDVVWTPAPGGRHSVILGELVRRHNVRANLVTDAQLAALAIEHGLTVCSADADFAVFAEASWHNPLGG